MRQIKKKVFEKYLIGVIAMAWIAGLLIAGCDSPYMPWVNGLGLLLFSVASILLGRFLNSGQLNTRADIYSNMPQQRISRPDMARKENKRINIRYALEI